MDLDTSTSKPFIRASAFAGTPTVDLPRAPSTGAAGELKAARGAVMALLGSMIMVN